MSEQLRLRDSGLEWRAVEGEVVALDMSESAYLAVNESGRRLWEELARGTTRASLIELLVSVYELAPEIAERDADAFLADLDRRGLLAPSG